VKLTEVEMKILLRVLPIVIMAAGTVASAVVAAEEPGSAAVSAEADACCFANPRYTGICQVTPGPDESCGEILAYLNNQASVGKTYCGNTKVRGGWTQVDCETSDEAAATDNRTAPSS